MIGYLDKAILQENTNSIVIFLPFLSATHCRFGKDFVSTFAHLVFRKNGASKMSTPGGMRISRHAAPFCAQRDKSPKCLAALLEHSVVGIAVGAGAAVFSVSRTQAAALDLPRNLRRHAAFVSDDSVLMMVPLMHHDQRGRKRRRGLGNGRGRG